jgi:DNA-binding NtrC family response regulator
VTRSGGTKVAISGSLAMESTMTEMMASPGAGEPGPGDNDFERFLRYAEQVSRDKPMSLRAFTDLAEVWRITQALRENGGNRSAAARALGIGRRTLYAKMDKLGIAPSWTVGERPD